MLAALASAAALIAPPAVGTAGRLSASTIATTPAAQLACVAALPLEVRIGQVLMLPVYGDALDASLAEIDGRHVGGVILMTWPDGADPAALLALKHDRAIDLLVATDEEGGDVQRLRRLGALPSAETVAETMTATGTERVIAAHAAAVAQLGIDVVFAPVVDLRPPGRRGPVGDRAFSDDPWVTAEYALATANGWRAAGILPVLKHFPGHGSATADTHHAAAVTPPLDELRDRDLLPYTAFAGRRDVGVMVGHLLTPGLTDADGLPASLSPAAITDLLRGELGFADNLVVTDALNMGAVTARFDTPTAAVLALAAGADVVLYATPLETAAIVAAITAAVDDGTLSAARLDDAAARVLRTKGVDACSP